jgi:hypothetical protein
MLDVALVLAQIQGARDSEAELYWLKGELLLAHAATHHAEAETWFR